MSAPEQKKKGYNIYQARLYTITDEIALKTTLVDIAEAQELLLGYFKQEQEGPLYARAVIRTINPVLKEWIIPWSVDNSSALLLNEETALIERWRITLYDMGDKVISSKEATEPISEQYARVYMMSANAFYSVISCQEAGTPNHFIISRTYRNKVFNLQVMGADPQRLQEQQKEPLEKCYERLLQEDAEETARINAQRRYHSE